jgi:hypothetical protein
MGKLFHVGDCIEGLSCEIISRDIKASSVQNDELIGRYIRYSCKRNSEAELLQELAEGAVRKYQYSDKNLKGTKLECSSMNAVVSGIKPIKPALINHSGRHKAQKMLTKSYTCAIITQAHHNIPGASIRKSIGDGEEVKE